MAVKLLINLIEFERRVSGNILKIKRLESPVIQEFES